MVNNFGSLQQHKGKLVYASGSQTKKKNFQDHCMEHIIIHLSLPFSRAIIRLPPGEILYQLRHEDIHFKTMKWVRSDCAVSPKCHYQDHCMEHIIVHLSLPFSRAIIRLPPGEILYQLRHEDIHFKTMKWVSSDCAVSPKCHYQDHCMEHIIIHLSLPFSRAIIRLPPGQILYQLSHEDIHFKTMKWVSSDCAVSPKCHYQVFCHFKTIFQV